MTTEKKYIFAIEYNSYSYIPTIFVVVVIVVAISPPFFGATWLIRGNTAEDTSEHAQQLQW